MIRHAAIYFVGFALPGLLGFVAFSVYTHLLPPAEYAVYSVGTGVAFLVGNVLFGWIRFSVGRFQSEDPVANFLPFALTCFGVTAGVAGPLVVAGARAVSDFTPLAIGAVVAMTLAQALFDITQEIQRSRHQSVAFARASVLRSVLSVGLSVAAAFSFRQGAVLLFSIASSFLIVAIAFFAVHRTALGRSRLDLAQLRRFLRYGFPLTLSGLVFAGNATLARVLVGTQLGADAAGRFGAALDVTTQLTGMLGGSIVSIMGPAAIIAYRRHGLEGAQRELSRGVILLMTILVPSVVGLMVTAHPFAAAASGPAFEQTVGDLLPLLALSRGLNVFSQFYLHLGFQIIERPMRQVACGATTLGLNVVLSLVLTHAFGLQGAAWAIVLADAAGVLVSLWLLAPVFPMPMPGADFARVFVSAGFMAAVCIALRSVLQLGPVGMLVAVAAAGCAAYATIGYLIDVADARSNGVLQRGYLALARFRS